MRDPSDVAENLAELFEEGDGLFLCDDRDPDLRDVNSPIMYRVSEYDTKIIVAALRAVAKLYKHRLFDFTRVTT